MTRPIEIIGGGLAGLSLGLALQRAGVSVTIIEAGSYPRHRVCGEFITGLDPATADALGLSPFLADAPRHHEVAWFLQNGPPRFESLPEPAIGISRYVLDHRLATAFSIEGGTLATGTRVAAPGAAPGRILATGRRRGRSDWLGLKVHVRGMRLTRDLEMHLGREAYVGLTRVAEDVVNVCGLFRRHRAPTAVDRREAGSSKVPPLLPYTMAECGLTALANRLADAELEPESFCAVAALRFDPTPPTPGTVRIGDAYAMIPPFTGDGMAMAFQSAATLLPFLLDYATARATWAETCHACERALRRRFRMRLASAGWLHPFLLLPLRQRWFTALGRARLLPFRALYHLVHA